MMQVHGLLPVPWYHDIWTVQFSLLFVSCVHGGNLAAMPRALLLSVCPALVVISKEKQSCLLRRHPKNRLVMLWTPVIQRGQRAKKSLQDFYQSSGLYLAAGLPSPSKALGPCKKKNLIHPERGMVWVPLQYLQKRIWGKKGYQWQKAIVRTDVGKWSNLEIIFWVYLAASEELVWTQASKWIRRLGLVWSKHTYITRAMFCSRLCYWPGRKQIFGEDIPSVFDFSIKSKHWYQLPRKHVEISWCKINCTSKIISMIICGKFPKLESWNNLFFPSK